MAPQSTSAPFTRAAVNAMRRLYPEALADKSFDNTGLLLEAPFNPTRRQKNSVLLTVDLTKAVANEAIERKASLVIAYHPIIFRGLKSLTLEDTQQQSLLRLASEGISVYSPHTAVDCASGGLGDWLADIVTGTPATAQDIQDLLSQQDSSGSSPVGNGNGDNKRPTYMLQHHPSQLSILDRALNLGNNDHERYPITKTKVPGHKDAGMGRVIRFNEPIALTEIIDRIGLGLGNPMAFPIAIPQGQSASDISIKSVALCAGSGGSLFSELEKNGETDIDLYFTGELSHHEALAAIEKGKCVICLFHSNTERGFLHSVLKPQLDEAVGEEWSELRQAEKAEDEASGDVVKAYEDVSVEILVSEVDRDPYGIMISKIGLEQQE